MLTRGSAGRQRAARSHDRLDLGDRAMRVVVSPELQQLVLQPRQRVIAAHRGRQTFLLDPAIGRIECRAIRSRGVVPQPELQEDVGRHVQRVA